MNSTPYSRRICPAFVFLFTTLLGAAVQATDLKVSTDPKGEKTTLDFKLEQGVAQPQLQMYLTNVGMDKTQVTLNAVMENSPLGVKVAAVADNTAFEIKKGRIISFVVSLGNVTRTGPLNGTLLIQVGTETTESVEFKVDRPGMPELKLPQADTDKNVKLAFQTRNPKFSLTVAETKGEAPAEVKVEVGKPFREDGVTSTDTNLELAKGVNHPIIVPRGGIGSLEFEATLPEAAKYRASIMLTVGKTSQLYTIYLERKARPDFLVVGAKPEGLSLPVSSREVRRQIAIQLAEGQPKVENFYPTLTALAREDGKPLGAAKLDFDKQAAVALTPGEYKSFVLVGENLEAGKYLAQMLLSDGTRTQIVPVDVTRAELTQNITIVEPGATESTVWWWCATGDAKVTINESLGRDAQTYYPRIESLQRVRDNQTTEMPRQPSILMQRRKCEWISIPDPSNPVSLVTIPQRGSKDFVFAIQDLGPGKYKGRVTVSGPDLAIQTKEFEIRVRHAFYWALLVIIAGVAGSYWLHTYTRVKRQQLVRLANVARTDDAIEKDAGSGPDNGVWTFLRSGLAKLRKDVRDDKSLTQAMFDSRLLNIQDRRKYNLLALSHQRNLDKVLSDYPPFMSTDKEEIQHSAATVMEQIVGDLQKEDRAGLEPENAPHRIEELGKKVLEARQTLIARPANDLLQEIEQLKSQSIVQMSFPAALKIQAIKNTVTIIVTQAGTDELGPLPRRLNVAYHDFIALWVHELQQIVDMLMAARHASQEGEVWNAFEVAIRQTTESLQKIPQSDHDPRSTFGYLRDASKTLQLTLIEFLDVLAAIGRPGEISQAEWDAWASERTLKDWITKSRNAFVAGEETTMSDAYRKAKLQYLDLQFYALNARLERLRKKIREYPKTLTEDGWAIQLSQEPLKSAVERLVSVAFDAQSDLATLEQDWQVKREAFMKNRLGVLTEAANAIDKLLPSAPSQVGTQLEGTRRILKQASDKLKESIQSLGADSQIALSQAEQLALDAQHAYETLIRLEKPGPAALAVAAPQEDPHKVAGVLDVTLASLDSRVAPRGVRPAANAFPFALTAGTAGSEPSSAELIQQINTWDAYVGWLAVGLASVGGLTVLWFPNGTWGSLSDYATALLWGFGLHEAGNGIIENLTSKGLWPQEK